MKYYINPYIRFACPHCGYTIGHLAIGRLSIVGIQGKWCPQCDEMLLGNFVPVVAGTVEEIDDSELPPT